MEDDVILTVSSRIKYEMVKDDSLPMEILRALAKDSDFKLRAMVAQHPELNDLETLELLATDEHVKVRMGVSINPNTPSSVIEILSKDSEEVVLFNLATHFNSTEDVLMSLYLNGTKKVKIALAMNRSTPFELLPRLLVDAGDLGREVIQERLKAGA